MISWDITQSLTVVVTKFTRLLKYIRIFGEGHFIYRDGHKMPSIKMHLRRHSKIALLSKSINRFLNCPSLKKEVIFRCRPLKSLVLENGSRPKKNAYIANIGFGHPLGLSLSATSVISHFSPTHLSPSAHEALLRRGDACILRRCALNDVGQEKASSDRLEVRLRAELLPCRIVLWYTPGFLHV